MTTFGRICVAVFLTVMSAVTVPASPASAQDVSVDLRVDTLQTVGEPTVVRAIITPRTDAGRVAFSLDGATFATVNVRRGVASIAWKPPTVGMHTLSARYLGDGIGDATASVVIFALAAAGPQASKPDVIVVDPDGALTPWVPGQSVTLPNGARRHLIASASSGATVTLTASGSCTLARGVLTTTSGSGACSLTASSPGGNGFSPQTQAYAVELVPGAQVADLHAPVSGGVARSTSFLLGSSGQVTDRGNLVSWSVDRRSTSACRIVERSTGTWLKAGSTVGTCVVRATAPGVAVQWRPFTMKRVYRVR